MNTLDSIEYDLDFCIQKASLGEKLSFEKRLNGKESK